MPKVIKIDRANNNNNKLNITTSSIITGSKEVAILCILAQGNFNHIKQRKVETK